MRLIVITDVAGEIVATVRPDAAGGKDGPERIGLVPESGQQIHEIELPPEMERMSADQLHLGIRERRLIPGAL